MAASSSQRDTYFIINPLLLADLEVLRSLRVENGDKLAVINGTLKKSETGFLQAPTRTWSNLIYGGHSYEDVTFHLETLAKKSCESLENLHELLNNPQAFAETNYRTLKIHKKRLAGVSSNLCDLYSACRSEVSIDVASRLTQVWNTFNALSKQLKDFLSENRIDTYQSAPNPPDLSVPVNLRKPLFKIPKGVTPQDVLELFRTAKEQTTGTLHNIGVRAISALGVTTGVVITSPVTLLKWSLWNPIELGRKGYIQSENPTSWFIHNMVQLTRSNIVSCPESLLERYAMAVINVPFVTDEHVEAFCKMAAGFRFDAINQFNLIQNYRIISDDAIELMEHISEALTNELNHLGYKGIGPQALQALSSRIASSKLGYVSSVAFFAYVKRYFSLLMWIDQPDWEDSFPRKDYETIKQGFKGENAEERKLYFLEFSNPINPETQTTLVTFINLQQLLKIINAAAENPTFTEFQPSSPYQIPALHQTLIQQGFVVKLSSYYLTYNRTNPAAHS